MADGVTVSDADLRNEAGVELHFVMPLLKYLGYQAKHVRSKESIEALSVSSGRRKTLYRPDFAISKNGHVRWICDAKAPSERLEEWKGQCKSYCHELNARYPSGQNPVAYYVLTNGLETRVYNWDSDRLVVSVKLDDVSRRNEKFQRLVEILNVNGSAFDETPERQPQFLIFRKKSANELNADFAWCHDQIHKKDALSYNAAFMEFVKLIFLKLLSDKQLHREFPELADPEVEVIQITDPAKRVPFSVASIIAAEEAGVDDPIAVKFRDLRDNLEFQIRNNRKKRIFNQGEGLNLSKEVIREIVRRLESTDLYGLDADLNGRLFEAFLNATLRGKALGQYFTPRSVVKLAVGIANLQVGPSLDACDHVIDACCGSGGFLIESLAAMWKKVDGLRGLTSGEKKELKENIAENCIYGVDSAKDPALARIARMNMYLHGDGGSAIFQIDALDKDLSNSVAADLEIKSEIEGFRKLMRSSPRGFASVALTNPPFAREYERSKRTGGAKGYKPSLLDAYELAYDIAHEGAPKKKLKSSAMFLERYLDFLRPGGRLITVIDDSVLGGKGFASTRLWLKSKFIVEGVISLPGDAFQRSEARVKTSILIMRKRVDQTEAQGNVFMYYSQYVGVDDPARERVLPIDEDNHRLAQREIADISRLFATYLTDPSHPDVTNWVVPPEALQSRWDVKACLLKPGRMVDRWRAKKLTVAKLSKLVDPLFVEGGLGGPFVDDDEITSRLLKPRIEASRRITHLRISYRGIAEVGEEKYSRDTEASVLFKVEAGDLVISHINALHGAIAIVPPELSGLYVTSEYSVLRVKPIYDPRLICSILRSQEVRSDILLTSTGIGRTRATWNELKDLWIPVPKRSVMVSFTEIYRQVEVLSGRLLELNKNLEDMLERHCELGHGDALKILESFKPPQ